jgi:hypothetical protein
LQQFDKNCADRFVLVTSTRDIEKTNFAFNITFTRDLLRQSTKIEVLGVSDDNDNSFSQKLVDFTVDMRKSYSGVKLPSIVKLLMANLESFNMNLNCQIPKVPPIVIANAYDDRFLPPFPVERRFVFRFISTAMVTKNKGWDREILAGRRKPGWENLQSGIVHFRFQRKVFLG